MPQSWNNQESAWRSLVLRLILRQGTSLRKASFSVRLVCWSIYPCSSVTWREWEDKGAQSICSKVQLCKSVNYRFGAMPRTWSLGLKHFLSNTREATKSKIWNSNVLSHKLFWAQCDYVQHMWDHIQIWTPHHWGTHLCWRFMKNAFINLLFRLNLYYKAWRRNTTVILSASSFYFHNLIEVTKAALEEVKSYGAKFTPYVCIDL